MEEKQYVEVAPEDETFRGYAMALDRELEAEGSVAIPFIAFAKMAGADVDKVFVKEDFERFMGLTAAEYGAEVKTRKGSLPENKDGFEVFR
jgi:hypothetical protein